MTEHQPRLWKPALFCLLAVLSIGLMYWDALVWPMAAAAILSLALAVLSAITLIWDKYIEAMYAEARKVEQYARMDPEQWNAIGLAIPTVRKVWQGLPIELWADTMARTAASAPVVGARAGSAGSLELLGSYCSEMAD